MGCMVLTPGGVIKVEAAAEARAYNMAYGYPYVKEREEAEDEQCS